MSVRVKICGVTSEADALAAAAAGADAIGLNFYPQSPRALSENQARAIMRRLPPFVEPIGLFVNRSWTEILSAADRLGLRSVQVHADQLEPCPTPALRWIAAFAVADQTSLLEIGGFMTRCPIERRPAAVLVDAKTPGLYGGTGKVAPWALLAGFDPGVPVILAGGLNPSNVAEAIDMVHPYAVDVASGVEKSPGRKDAEQMRVFVEAVRRGTNRHGSAR